ncbi:Cyclic nucleotide-binding domain-containing protein 2 [Chytriomyces hyalinus]|nr:Cyclic nucleotide-binding domain-containing protein 2 [Chytriomyces hyalinus]
MNSLSHSRGGASLPTSPGVKIHTSFNLSDIPVSDSKHSVRASSEIPTVKKTKVSGSSNLKRASGSGDVQSSASEKIDSNNNNYTLTAADAPQIRFNSRADVGGLRRHGASGNVLADYTSLSLESTSQLAETPKLQDASCQDSSLKRVNASVDFVSDYDQHTVPDSVVAVTPVVQNAQPDASLKRVGGSNDILSASIHSLTSSERLASDRLVRQSAETEAFSLYQKMDEPKSSLSRNSNVTKGSLSLSRSSKAEISWKKRNSMPSETIASYCAQGAIQPAQSNVKSTAISLGQPERKREEVTPNSNVAKEGKFDGKLDDTKSGRNVRDSQLISKPSEVADPHQDAHSMPHYVTLRKKKSSGKVPESVHNPQTGSLAHAQGQMERYSMADGLGATLHPSNLNLPRPPTVGRVSPQVFTRSTVRVTDSKVNVHNHDPDSKDGQDTKSVQARIAVEHYVTAGISIVEDAAAPPLLLKHQRVERHSMYLSQNMDDQIERAAIEQMHKCVNAEISNPKLLYRHRWRYSIFCITRLPKESLADRLTDRSNPARSKSDVIFSSKIRALMIGNRETALVKALHKLLQLKTQFLHNLNRTQQRALCGVIEYVSTPKGAIIVKEGEERRHIYFILLGKCKKKGGGKTSQSSTLTDGDSFGSPIFGNWTATVQCVEETEFLRVRREEYAAIVNDVEDQKQTMLSIVSKIPHFVAPASNSVIRAAAKVGQHFIFKPQEPILHEGVENYSIFWIVKGTCHAVKLVAFLKRPVVPSSSSKDSGDVKNTGSKKYKLAEFEPGVTPIRTGEKVVTQLLTTREFGPGDYFPDVIGAETAGKLKFNRADFLSRLRETRSNRMDARSYVSIIATTNVEIFGMTYVEYAEIATTDMLFELFSNAPNLRIPISELQQSVLKE